MSNFNNLVGGIVPFYSHGDTFNIKVKKDAARTILHGEGWRRFVRDKNLNGGEMIHFNLAAEVPRITIIIFNFGSSDDDDDEEEENAVAEATMFAQRCYLNDPEQYHLLDILPPENTFIGVPFVTRLTSTHVNRYDMFSYLSICNLNLFLA
jgi:hypothetical protein